MIESNVREELIKNKVLSVNSQKFDNINYSNFTGEVVLNIDGVYSSQYAILYVNFVNAVGLEIYSGTVLLLKAESSGCNIIPLKVSKNTQIRLSGAVEKISLNLQNAYFGANNSMYILPSENKLICSTDVSKVYSYNNYNDIIDNKMNLTDEYNNVVCLQLVKIDFVTYIACIEVNGSVYFCIDKDNYTNKIYISDKVESVKIIPSNDSVFVVYIRDSKLYYRQITNALVCLDEKEIYLDINYIPKIILDVQINNIGVLGFLVYFSNKSIGLYIYEIDNFYRKITKYCENARLVIDGNELTLITIVDCCLQLYKYNAVRLDSGILQLNCLDRKQLDNVTDAIQLADGYLVYTANAVSYISNDKL